MEGAAGSYPAEEPQASPLRGRSVESGLPSEGEAARAEARGSSGHAAARGSSGYADVHGLSGDLTDPAKHVR